MSIFGRLFACAKTRLSACIFFLLLQKSRSASPHVEGCCCTILAIKRIPLLSCAAMSKHWHPCQCLDVSLHAANSLLWQEVSGSQQNRVCSANSKLKNVQDVHSLTMTSVYRIRVKFLSQTWQLKRRSFAWKRKACRTSWKNRLLHKIMERANRGVAMICTEMFEKFLYFLVDLGKYESYNFYKRGGWCLYRSLYFRFCIIRFFWLLMFISIIRRVWFQILRILHILLEVGICKYFLRKNI